VGKFPLNGFGELELFPNPSWFSVPESFLGSLARENRLEKLGTRQFGGSKWTEAEVRLIDDALDFPRRHSPG